MKFLAALARVLFGFVLACIAAGFVTVLFVNTPIGVLAEPIDRLPQTASEIFDLALLTATHTALFAFVFVLIIAAMAEWLSVRSLPYYLIAGAAISALGFFAQYSSEVSGQPTILNNYALKTFLTSGFFGGFVYWLAAGQFAGRAPQDARNSDPVEIVPIDSRTTSRMADASDAETKPVVADPEPATERTFNSASLLNRLKLSQHATSSAKAEDDEESRHEAGAERREAT
ncbi:hypothetical protein DLM45_08170 [Hyphomicrobium methylovorum]|nr:hypothetical protein [Hyphomicrobium methylovorum]